tara:strand:- start:146 stop:922 length:777 start_codon:yes stop_codon:yes gene_type:complete
MSVMTAIAIGSALMGASNASKTRKQAKKQAQQALKDRKEQQKKVDFSAAEYNKIKFTNPYEGMENQYANMENVYEDLTVNQQQAQFQAQQGQQQRANIMQSLRGAAGSSGIAGLAQSMANQGQLQAQQISASIGAQESANQRLTAQGAGAIQQAERAGAGAVDMQIRQGDAMVQQAESGRQATILAAQYGQAAGANTNYQQSMLNQQNASTSANQMNMNALQSLSKIDFSGSGGNDFTPTPSTYNPIIPGPTNYDGTF